MPEASSEELRARAEGSSEAAGAWSAAAKPMSTTNAMAMCRYSPAMGER
jgi:hypothetical protein